MVTKLSSTLLVYLMILTLARHKEEEEEEEEEEAYQRERKRYLSDKTDPAPAPPHIDLKKKSWRCALP